MYSTPWGLLTNPYILVSIVPPTEDVYEQNYDGKFDRSKALTCVLLFTIIKASENGVEIERKIAISLSPFWASSH